MTTPLRKLRVSDEEYARWQTAAPDGNVSAWLRGLAADALAASARLGGEDEGGRKAVAESAVSRGNAPQRPPDVVRALARESRAELAPLDVPAVTIGQASPDPARAEYLRREAALAATFNPKE